MLFYQCKKKDATHFAQVEHGDGEIVLTYYSVSADSSPVKRERYTMIGESLVLAGVQEYIRDGQVYCKEEYRNGKLIRSTWIDTGGVKRKVYLVRDKKVMQLLELYPTGKTKMTEKYAADMQAMPDTHYYDEAGNELSFTRPDFIGKADSLQYWLNKYMDMPEGIYFSNTDILLSGTIDSQSHFHLINAYADFGWFSCKYPSILNRWRMSEEEYSMKMYQANNDAKDSANRFVSDWLKSHLEMLEWNAGTVDGKPSTMDIKYRLRYSPLQVLHDNDTIYPHIIDDHQDGMLFLMGLVGRSYVLKDVVLYSRSQKNVFTSTPDSIGAYALLHTNKDTIIVTGYDSLGNIWFVNRYGQGKNSIYQEGQQDYFNHKQELRYQENYEAGRLKSTLFLTTYGEKEIFRFNNVGKSRTTPSEKEELIYYPSGELMKRAFSVYEDYNSTSSWYAKYPYPQESFYDKQGNSVSSFELPSYKNGTNGLSAYLRKNYVVDESLFSEKAKLSSVKINVQIEADGTLSDLVVCDLKFKDALSFVRTRMVVTLENEERMKESIKQCLMQAPAEWRAGTVNGIPTAMRVNMTLQYTLSF